MPAPYDYYSQIQLVDPTARFMAGVQAAQQQQAEQARIQKQQAFQSDLMTAYENPDSVSAIAELIKKYPEAQKDIKEAMAFAGAEKSRQYVKQISPIYAAVINKKTGIAVDQLNALAEGSRRAGKEEDALQYEALAKTIEADPDGASISLGTAMASAMGPEDFVNTFGLITKTPLEIKELEKKLENDVDLVGAQGVQSSQILSDGSTVIVTKKGETVVRNPFGEIVTGAKAAATVRNAQEYGVDLQGLRARERKTQEATVKQIQETAGAFDAVQRNIGNLDSAISALEQGAQTGVIAERFPDWSASTIELRNLQRQLGLDVIGSVTFGALSEGELNLALETALPTQMQPAELIDWLKRKKSAQEKLATYLDDQINFLAEGNTVEDWLKRKRRRPTGTTRKPTATSKKLSPRDQAALDWANANPSDPRAGAIKNRLGVK